MIRPSPWLGAVLLLAAGCDDPPAAPRAPPETTAPEPLPADLSLASPEQLVRAFDWAWETYRARFATDRPSPWLLESLRVAADLKRPFMTQEMNERERRRLDRFEQAARALPAARVEILSTDSRGEDAVTIAYRRIVEGTPVRVEAAVEVVRRDGRWWIGTVRAPGPQGAPLQLVQIQRLTLVPEGHVWTEARETPQNAARAWAELHLRAQGAQTELMVAGLRAFLADLRRFCLPEPVDKLETQLNEAVAQARTSATKVQPSGVIIFMIDPTRAYFLMAAALDPTIAAARRVELVKADAEWLVSGLSVAHAACRGTGKCPACGGSGKVQGQSFCAPCKGGGRCGASECNGSGYVPE
jgi:hypothetical protein